MASLALAGIVRAGALGDVRREVSSQLYTGRPLLQSMAWCTCGSAQGREPWGGELNSCSCSVAWDLANLGQGLGWVWHIHRNIHAATGVHIPPGATWRANTLSTAP